MYVQGTGTAKNGTGQPVRCGIVLRGLHLRPSVLTTIVPAIGPVCQRPMESVTPGTALLGELGRRMISWIDIAAGPSLVHYGMETSAVSGAALLYLQLIPPCAICTAEASIVLHGMKMPKHAQHGNAPTG